MDDDTPRGDEIGFNLLEIASETVRRQDERGKGVDLPAWFDVQLEREGWPTKLVVSVNVDAEQGPVMTGLRTDRNSSTTHAEAMRLLKSAVPESDGGVKFLLRVLTSHAAGAYVVGQVQDALAGDQESTAGMATRIRGLRNDYAHFAYSATNPQRRRLVTTDHLTEVSKVYREAVAGGASPTKSVAAHFTTTHSTAARWVREARKVGLLGPSLGTRAGEAEPANPSE
jgi:hypothetical protein